MLLEFIATPTFPELYPITKRFLLMRLITLFSDQCSLQPLFLDNIGLTIVLLLGL